MLLKYIIIVFAFCLISANSFAYNVQDIRGNQYNLINSAEFNNIYIVFFSTLNCHECCITMGKELEERPYVVIARSVASPTSMRRLIGIIHRHFKDARVLFEITEEPDAWPPRNLSGGMFGKYRVSIAPALGYISAGKMKFYTYSSMFGDGVNSTSVIRRIFEENQ